ncbi:MAG: hypothetical protein CVT83_04305, partial [Alphaproteobacteria bacterium HGW-Alphaproteobacteria-5]
NALELAVLTTAEDEAGEIRITREIAAESSQKKVIKLDEQLFYDMLSAFCKSLRGGDSDAAIAWFTRLLYAGVDPRIIARRLIAHRPMRSRSKPAPSAGLPMNTMPRRHAARWHAGEKVGVWALRATTPRLPQRPISACAATRSTRPARSAMPKLRILASCVARWIGVSSREKSRPGQPCARSWSMPRCGGCAHSAPRAVAIRCTFRRRRHARPGSM